MHVHTHTYKHTDQLLCLLTLALPSTCTHLISVNTAAELKLHAHSVTRTQGLRLKERLGSIITPAQRRLAFGLKDSIVLFFFFFGRGDGGVSKMESRPSGARQRQSSVEISDSCFYHPRWTVLLFQLSQSVSLAERRKNYKSITVFFFHICFVFCPFAFMKHTVLFCFVC